MQQERGGVVIHTDVGSKCHEEDAGKEHTLVLSLSFARVNTSTHIHTHHSRACNPCCLQRAALRRVSADPRYWRWQRLASAAVGRHLVLGANPGSGALRVAAACMSEQVKGEWVGWGLMRGGGGVGLHHSQMEREGAGGGGE